MASTPSGTVAGSAIAPVALPATGLGVTPISSVSILALLLMSAVALAAGAFTALLGRRRELEDDGISLE